MNNSKVKVAVRVRPLNKREEELNSQCVVRVSGNQITLQQSSSCKEKDRKEPHIFTFDNCFWTEDRHNTGQEEVFRHLGEGVLENIWLGYNVCVFAYGQTGSGKSFSMMGTNDQPGVVPRLCSALFNKECNDFETIRIEASYFEIYNEDVRDLLSCPKKQRKLRVREDRLLGPYVEELSSHAVQSYEEIKLLLDQGNKQRAIAETKMNEQSSRSHAILTITVTQTCSNPKSGASRELGSKVSLVDLAGSERNKKSGAQGRQLKESCNINKSLLTLSQVINSLAEISGNKGKSHYVNYRDSVLTWLLKNNLGGNSKTIMLATVSPAADNYQETLSTLKYADSAKRIINQPVVNEDVKSKAIEELHEEIKRLRQQLTTTEQVKKAEVQELKSKLEEKENLLRDLETSWEEKLKKTEIATQEWQKNLKNMGIILNEQDVVFSNQCYLIQNYPKLIIHTIHDITKIGSGPSQDIHISGSEAECEHCVIRKTEEGDFCLIPVGNSKISINGCFSKTTTQLWHEDKIQMGTNVFTFQLPDSPKPEHMKTHVSTEANTQTHDRLTSENEDEKLKTNSKSSANDNTTEGFAIQVSNSFCNFSKNKQKTDVFSQISSESNSHSNNMNVNTTGDTQSEYLVIGDGTHLQDSMVQCSPRYGEASSQTSESSTFLQIAPHLQHHVILPSTTMSEEECSKHLTIFTRDPNTDVTQLAALLSETSSYNITLLCYCCHCKSQLKEEDCKSVIDRSSVIILYHFHSPWGPLPHMTDMEEFLEHCREQRDPDIIKVVITDMEDVNLERQITEWWKDRRFRDWELLTLSQAEMSSLYGLKISPLSMERRTAYKHSAPEETLPPLLEGIILPFLFIGLLPLVVAFKLSRPSEKLLRKHGILGIFSRSSEEENSWLRGMLEPEYKEVKSFYIGNNTFRQFMDDVSQCTFGILHHSKNQGRVNVTDVTDSLYDHELEYMSKKLGKRRVCVIIDDLDDNSENVKQLILRTQPKIWNLAKSLFLIKQGTAEQKMKDFKP